MNKSFSLIDLSCDSSFDSSILEISNLTLGKGYLTPLSSYRGLGGVILGSIDASINKINGFCVGRVINRDEFKREFKFEFNEFDSFGVIDPVCVDPEYQKIGIGSCLINKTINSLKAPVFVSPVWSYVKNTGDRATNAGKSFENAGFKSKFYLPQFWKEECGTNFQCPSKNLLNECSCGISLYVKHNYPL